MVQINFLVLESSESMNAKQLKVVCWQNFEKPALWDSTNKMLHYVHVAVKKVLSQKEIVKEGRVSTFSSVQFKFSLFSKYKMYKTFI